MEYESTILKRLIETYGVVGNPRYISEIIKEFIVRGKELYPQLFTYQSDWLAHIDEFGLTPDYVVSYTGQQIYAPHTKERPVKSAILTGSTKYRDIDTGEFLEAFEEGRNLELVSVKMPVLTTTGKNLFDKNKLEDGDFNQYGEPTVAIGRCRTIDYIPVKGGSKLTLSKLKTEWFKVFGYDNNKNFVSIVFDRNSSQATFTIPSNVCFIKIKFDYPLSTAISDNIQLEIGTQATSYEPYKTNILTVNEEVELCGVGDVQDTLDLMTGEVVNNFASKTVSNSITTFYSFTTPTNQIAYNFRINGRKENGRGNMNLISNDLSVGSYLQAINDENFFGLANNGQFLTLKTNFSTLEDANNWIENNNFTVLYEVAEKVHKTVDLNILDQNGQNVKQLMSFNGGTHFTTSSQEGSLLPSISVDVVTDLEETLNLCSTDGNTL